MSEYQASDSRRPLSPREYFTLLKANSQCYQSPWQHYQVTSQFKLQEKPNRPLLVNWDQVSHLKEGTRPWDDTRDPSIYSEVVRRASWACTFHGIMQLGAIADASAQRDLGPLTKE